MKLTVKDIAEARGFKNAKQLADASGVHYQSITRSGPAKRSSLAWTCSDGFAQRCEFNPACCLRASRVRTTCRKRARLRARRASLEARRGQQSKSVQSGHAARVRPFRGEQR